MKLSRNKILWVCSFLFLLLGLITAAIGPVLPQLASNTGASLAAAGAVFTAIFLGALAAQVVTGPLGDRLGYHKVLLAGLVLMAGGILGITFSRSLTVTLLFAFLAGIGHGGLDLGGNVLIALIFNGRAVSALNLLNLFFGLGAFGGPALISLSLKLWDTGLPVLWLTAGLMALSAVLLLDLNLDTQSKPPAPAQKEAAGVPRRSVLGSPLLWVLGLVILIYVGTENGMGGWTTTYLQRTAAMPVETAALITAGFWLAITAGRLVSSALGLRLSSLTLLLGSLSISALGGALLTASQGSPAASSLGVLLVGFGFGAVYPTMLAFTTGQFAEAPGQAGSLVAAMGSIGGSLLPWAQGQALEKIGVASTAWFSLGGAGLMLCLLLFARALTRSRSSAHPVLQNGQPSQSS